MNAPGIDAARLTGLFTELRLPTIKVLWPQFTEQADQEGWPGARLLSALAELEITERAKRRRERHLAEARLPPPQRASITSTSSSFPCSPKHRSWPSLPVTPGSIRAPI